MGRGLQYDVSVVCVGKKMVGEQDIRKYLDKFDKKYWATYKVLDILQKVFYRSNPAREAFVEMCSSDYVQKMTFDSYLYKTVVPGNPLDDAKLAWQVSLLTAIHSDSAPLSQTCINPLFLSLACLHKPLGGNCLQFVIPFDCTISLRTFASWVCNATLSNSKIR